MGVLQWLRSPREEEREDEDDDEEGEGEEEEMNIDGGFEEDVEVEPGDVGDESADRAAGATEAESM